MLISLAVVHLQDAQARALQAATSTIRDRDAAHVPRRARAHDVPVLEGEFTFRSSLKSVLTSPEFLCECCRLNSFLTVMVTVMQPN